MRDNETEGIHVSRFRLHSLLLIPLVPISIAKGSRLGQTSMPYFRIFLCSVGREIPSSSHTLPRLPRANLRAFRICSFSTSSSSFIEEEAMSVSDFEMSPTDSAKLSSN